MAILQTAARTRKSISTKTPREALAALLRGSLATDGEALDLADWLVLDVLGQIDGCLNDDCPFDEMMERMFVGMTRAAKRILETIYDSPILVV